MKRITGLFDIHYQKISMNNKIFIFSIVTICLLFNCAPNIPQFKKNENLDLIVKVSTFNVVSSNYNGEILFGKQIAQNIAALFEKEHINADTNSQSEANYKIEGEIKLIDKGSWVLRFLFGFIGMAKIEMISRLTYKNKVINEINNSRLSSSYLGQDKILQRLCLELSEDVKNEFIKDIINNIKEPETGIEEK